MNPFADLHCHILPDADDGPKTMDEAMDMLRIAQEEGFSDIVATPHYAPEIPGFCKTMNIAAEIIKLQRAAKHANLSIQLHCGSEIRLSEQAYKHFSEGRCLPLGNSRYILLELPDAVNPEECYGWMLPFVQNGWTPILAHVERLTVLQKSVHALSDWTDMGCLLQVNASSITTVENGLFKRTAKNLIKKKLCHLIATDAHSSIRRAPLIQDAYKKTIRWVGEASAHDLFYLNTRKILGLS